MDNDKKVILVIDDDPSIRDALKFNLELEGLSVHTAASGTDLLHHPALDQARCLVLDYKMPGMDGLQVAEYLTARKMKVPVILITSPVTDAIRLRAGRAGVAHVLEKPLLDNLLIDRIREVVA